MKMKRQDAEILLKDKFRIERFYDKQWEVIDKLLNGKRVLLIEKTGYGKSLCFQFTAVMLDGLTVIFSPLISLMRDQIKKLNSLGINAKCINSEQTDEENEQVINDAMQGRIKILYIAPERQENNQWIESALKMKLSMVVVDEAHCISVWGHDFRPSYRRIINLVKLLPQGFPVLAATATATKRVEEDIANQIGSGIEVIRGNLMRDNFRLFVIKVNSEDEKFIWLGQNLKNLEGSGVIYTGTRVNTEMYSRWFEFLGIKSVNYNAGLDARSRIEIENGLMNNEWKCVVSTNALGMGIDKPDIRFIIHTQIPQSPIHYYQEIGRAGRDGLPTDIILFFNPEDEDLPVAFIEGGRPSVSKYHKVIEAVKNEMLGERELMKKTNLKQTQVRVIKADLLEQGIVREVTIGKSKKLEYIPNAPVLNFKTFEELRNAKLKELDSMIQYVNTPGSRMKFLCDFLGDSTEVSNSNCDNTGLQKLTVYITPEWNEKLKEFRDNYFPGLEVESKRTNMVNGVAASYYGFSNVGKILHRCKYENGGDYPDSLVVLTINAFREKLGQYRFDLILYVPPTKSGNLVKNFSEKISQKLKIPVSHNLKKTRVTKEQKIFENNPLKAENVKNAFNFENRSDILNKKILLIDDIFDSGTTMKEIGKYLTESGAALIAPLVIAKTVGGDLI